MSIFYGTDLIQKQNRRNRRKNLYVEKREKTSRYTYVRGKEQLDWTATATELTTKNEAKKDVNEKDVTRKSHKHGHKLDIGSGHALDIGTRHKLDGDTNWRLNSSKELEETRKNDYTGKEPKTN